MTMAGIALVIGYGVMSLGALMILAFIAAILLRLVWTYVVRPVHLMADYQEWRRAKSSGAWRWPRVTSEADEGLK